MVGVRVMCIEGGVALAKVLGPCHLVWLLTMIRMITIMTTIITTLVEVLMKLVIIGVNDSKRHNSVNLQHSLMHVF